MGPDSTKKGSIGISAKNCTCKKVFSLISQRRQNAPFEAAKRESKVTKGAKLDGPRFNKEG